jgi:hypothetical protein
MYRKLKNNFIQVYSSRKKIDTNFFRREYKEKKIPPDDDPVGTEYQIRIRSAANGNYLTAEKIGTHNRSKEKKTMCYLDVTCIMWLNIVHVY